MSQVYGKGEHSHRSLHAILMTKKCPQKVCKLGFSKITLNQHQLQIPQINVTQDIHESITTMYFLNTEAWMDESATIPSRPILSNFLVNMCKPHMFQHICFKMEFSKPRLKKFDLGMCLSYGRLVFKFAPLELETCLNIRFPTPIQKDGGVARLI